MKTIGNVKKKSLMLSAALMLITCQAQAQSFSSPDAQYRFKPHSTLATSTIGYNYRYTIGTSALLLGRDYLFDNYQYHTFGENLRSSAWGYRANDYIGIMPVAVGPSTNPTLCPNFNCSMSVTMATNSCVSREVTSSADLGVDIGGFSLSGSGSISNGAEYCSEVQLYEGCQYNSGASGTKETPVIGIGYRWAVWSVGGDKIYFSPTIRAFVNRADVASYQQTQIDAGYALCRQQGMSAGVSKTRWKQDVAALGYCYVPTMSLQYEAFTQTPDAISAGCLVTPANIPITKGNLLRASNFTYTAN
jgi:hypothetical protein